MPPPDPSAASLLTFHFDVEGDSPDGLAKEAEALASEFYGDRPFVIGYLNAEFAGVDVDAMYVAHVSTEAVAS